MGTEGGPAQALKPAGAAAVAFAGPVSLDHPLRTHGFGQETGLNLLVLSNRLKGTSIEESHVRAMKEIFATPQKLLGDHRYVIDYVLIERGSDEEHDVVFSQSVP